MQSQMQSPVHRAPSHPIYVDQGLSLKKTAFIIVTVIGCIAILWPKVFYPMMFGGAPPKPNIKEQRPPGADFRTGLRQERQTHLHPDSIYQAMRERGRAIIPSTTTIPIVERKGKGSLSKPPPRIVEGRPGPIPGMRPPMGAGAFQQPQARGSSMGFLMPLYTIGIIIFFGYTILKIVFKKPIPNAPYGPAPSDPNFRKEVFGQGNGGHVDDINGTKIGTNTSRSGKELYNASISATNAANRMQQQHYQHQKQHQHHQQLQVQHQPLIAACPISVSARTETEQLMEIEKLRKRLEETEKAMAKLIAEMNSDQYETKKSNEKSSSSNGDISIGHTSANDENKTHDEKQVALDESQKREESKNPATQDKDVLQRNRRDGSADRSISVLGMEVTASCEGGKKWTGRPPTPVLLSHNEHSKEDISDMPEPQSIYLEGSLAHESQILVSDSETRTEEVYDEELNGSYEEPAVILSSKMTLSLINMDSSQEKDTSNQRNEIESPLADDIEIIGHDEK